VEGDVVQWRLAAKDGIGEFNTIVIMILSRGRFLFFVLMLIACLNASGQDHLYSQFYNAPIYLNPALTGQFDGDFRVSLLYRNQYTTSGNNSNYLTASADYTLPEYNSAVGLMFNRSSEGNAFLNANNVAGVYSYTIGGDDYILSFGLQVGISNRSIDYSKLIFDDQIDPTIGIIPGATSAADALTFNSKYYFDAGFGINYVLGSFMAGGSLQHLNGPDDSFTGVPEKLPIRGTAYAAYRFDLFPDANLDDEEKSYIIPSAVLYRQSTSQVVTAGLEYKQRKFAVGLFYRSGGISGPSAVVVTLVFDLFNNSDTGEKLKFGLSHDITTTGLNYSNTSGTTEGSLNYQTINENRPGDSYRYPDATRPYQFY
jgi:type IX secretion system PorP/SprF family membrane protein